VNAARGPLVVVNPSLAAVEFIAPKPEELIDPTAVTPAVRVYTPNLLVLVAASTGSNASAGTPCEDRDLAWKCAVFQSSGPPGALPCVSLRGSLARGGVATAATSPDPNPSPNEPLPIRRDTYSVEDSGACV
jgi:hypothetical protein